MKDYEKIETASSKYGHLGFRVVSKITVILNSDFCFGHFPRQCLSKFMILVLMALDVTKAVERRHYYWLSSERSRRWSLWGGVLRMAGFSRDFTFDWLCGAASRLNEASDWLRSVYASLAVQFGLKSMIPCKIRFMWPTLVTPKSWHKQTHKQNYFSQSQL